MRRILHVTMSDTFSGAENVACQIISMFKSDPGVEMLYCGIEGEKIRSALKERKIKFVPMSARNPREVYRVIKKTQPAIIHAHDMKASFYVALTCGKIPLVSHIHNLLPYTKESSERLAAFIICSPKMPSLTY